MKKFNKVLLITTYAMIPLGFILSAIGLFVFQSFPANEYLGISILWMLLALPLSFVGCITSIIGNILRKSPFLYTLLFILAFTLSLLGSGALFVPYT